MNIVVKDHWSPFHALMKIPSFSRVYCNAIFSIVHTVIGADL